MLAHSVLPIQDIMEATIMEPTLTEYLIGSFLQLAIPAVIGGGILIWALNARKKNPPKP
tara:strand:+ start:34678 stop:34854 length:177 start_codon:yes stop_codon:yes gene_type:complete